MTKSRLSFIDLTRGMAMLVMIEVHVVNSMMDTALRSHGWFHFVNFINGMVAPSFIFISGFSFMLACQVKLESFRRFKYDFWKQAGRILLIWFTGYMLHIPFFSLYKCQNSTNWVHWIRFFSVDVLQCIATGLLVIFILRLVIKSDRIFIAAVTLLGLAAVLPAPYIYTIEFERFMPFFLAAYLSPVYFTLFPVFPWFGFMAFGALSAWVFMKFREQGREAVYMKRALIAGALLTLVCLPLMFYLKDYVKLFTDIRPSILFFAGRLGFLYVILAASYYYCALRGEPSGIILYPSRESLAVYFMHLQVLYREVLPGGRSLVTMFPNTLGFGTCLLISLAIILAMLPMARAWNHWKNAYRYFGRIAVFTMITGGAVIFLLR